MMCVVEGHMNVSIITKSAAIIKLYITIELALPCDVILEYFRLVTFYSCSLMADGLFKQWLGMAQVPALFAVYWSILSRRYNTYIQGILEAHIP